jgi:hypothetical protein
MDDAETDLINTSNKRRGTRAFHRTKWTFVIREAKSKLKGCCVEEYEDHEEVMTHVNSCHLNPVEMAGLYLFVYELNDYFVSVSFVNGMDDYVLAVSNNC